MSFHLRLISVCLAILLVQGVRVACAAEDKAAKESDKAQAGQSKDQDKQNDKPDEPSLLDKLTKELLKDVDDGAPKPAAQQENKLDRAARGMRRAGEKLDEHQTGKDTRAVQEQVIKDLDDLIKQLQNPPPPQGGGGGGGGSSSSSAQAGKAGQSMQQKMSASAGQGQRGKPQGLNSSKPQGAEAGQQGGQDKQNAEGSSERTESERKAADEAARKKKLEMDVWGHLPPHLRDQLLNTYGERMLPKYQQLVKQFYEALSDQREPSPRR